MRIDADNIFNYYLLEASKAKYRGDFNQALQYYHNCYKLDDKSSAVMYEISRLYYATKKMDEANLWLDKSISLDSTNNAEYIKYAATLKLYSGRYAESKEYYKKLVSMESDVPTYRLMLARLYSQLNMPDSAHICLDQISLDQVPWSAIQLEHADLYTHESNVRKLEKTLKNILKREPNEASSYKHLADYYFVIKKPKKALNYLTSGLTKNDGDLLLLDIADYYFKIGDYPLFKQYIDQAIHSVSISAETKIRKLTSYLQDKDKELYLRNESDYFTYLLKSAVSFHQDDEQLTILLAQYLNSLSRTSEALKVFDSYFVSHSPSYDFFATYVFTIMSQPELDWHKLNHVITDAYSLFPDQPYIVEARALTYNHFDKYQETIDVLTEFLTELDDIQLTQQLKSIKVEFLNILAESYYGLGKTEDSFATYDAVLSLDPNYIVALNNYAYYLSLHNVRLDDAEKMSSKTISVEPNNPTYLDTYAWVLYKKEQFSIAKIMIEAAFNYSTSPSSELYEHYGFILKAVGDTENSVIQFRKAIELDSKKDYLKEFLTDEN